jgi:uncharacterized protein (DUF779 family)
MNPRDTTMQAAPAGDPATADSVERVTATEAALALIAELRAEHGALMFHQSGGCCDGSSPMCYPQGELLVGDADVLLGVIDGCPFYMTKAQFAYWRYTQLTLDVVPGRGGMFSLEGPTGKRFLIRSRLFTDAECAALGLDAPALPR